MLGGVVSPIDKSFRCGRMAHSKLAVASSDLIPFYLPVFIAMSCHQVSLRVQGTINQTRCSIPHDTRAAVGGSRQGLVGVVVVRSSG